MDESPTRRYLGPSSVVVVGTSRGWSLKSLCTKGFTNGEGPRGEGPRSHPHTNTGFRGCPQSPSPPSTVSSPTAIGHLLQPLHRYTQSRRSRRPSILLEGLVFSGPEQRPNFGDPETPPVVLWDVGKAPVRCYSLYSV